jgi:hypothetical protein
MWMVVQIPDRDIAGDRKAEVPLPVNFNVDRVRISRRGNETVVEISLNKE